MQVGSAAAQGAMGGHWLCQIGGGPAARDIQRGSQKSFRMTWLPSLEGPEE